MEEKTTGVGAGPTPEDGKAQQDHAHDNDNGTAGATDYRTRPIPEELKAVPHWVVWKYVPREGKKPAKVPHQAGNHRETRNGRLISPKGETDNPNHWSIFKLAVHAYSDPQFDDYAGIGFVFSQTDPFAGIDLDDCRNPETGEITETARQIIERLNSYTEISPSKTGVKIIVRGVLPEHVGEDGKPRTGVKKQDIEIYDRGRYFTITGDHLPGTPLAVEDRNTALSAVYAEVRARDERKAERNRRKQRGEARETTGVQLGDFEILTKARRSGNRRKFRQLWLGLWERVKDDRDLRKYPSQSEADMALLGTLRFWTCENAGQMDRLFRLSRLYRSKWDEIHHGDGSTYGEESLQRAIARGGDVYGSRSEPAQGTDERTVGGAQSAQQGSENDQAKGPKGIGHFGILTLEELDLLPEGSPLINEVYDTGSLVVTYGPSNVGKTILVLDQAFSMCCDQPWQGIPTKGGAVLWIAGEGVDNLRKLAKGWLQHHRQQERHPFWVIRRPINFPDPESAAKLIADIKLLPEKPVMIVVDTLSKNFGGQNESQTQDMQQFTLTCNLVRLATGVTVHVIHHTGQDKSRARGNYSLICDMETVWRVEAGPGCSLTLSNEKLKGSHMPDTAFLLSQHGGNAGSYAVISRLDAVPPGEEIRWKDRILAVLYGETGPIARKELAARLGIEGDHPGSFKKALYALKKDKWTVGDKGVYSITDMGRMAHEIIDKQGKEPQQ